jgi:hypothetical protein
VARKLLLGVLALVTATSVAVAVRAMAGATARTDRGDVTVRQSPLPRTGAGADSERAVRQRRAEYLQRDSGQVPWTPGR